MNHRTGAPDSRKQSRARIAGASAVVIGALALSGCNIDDSGNAKIKSEHKTNHKSSQPAAPDTPTADPGIRPTRDKVGVKFVLKSKQCFGSAGCNIEYNVTVQWLGVGSPRFNDDYDLKYAVTGDESGPQIDTIVLHPNGKYDVPYGGVLSVPSQYTKPAARVLSISKHVGY